MGDRHKNQRISIQILTGCTNFWLKKWNLIDNDNCTFCHTESEKAVHLFWNCEHVKQFWLNFNNYLATRIGTSFVDFDVNAIFYGVNNCDRRYMYIALYNTLIFNAKRYIYECRYAEKKPEFNSFVHKIKYIQKTEFEIAKQNNDITKWQEKWSPLEEWQQQ